MRIEEELGIGNHSNVERIWSDMVGDILHETIKIAERFDKNDHRGNDTKFGSM
jgi:hypothetical protein